MKAMMKYGMLPVMLCAAVLLSGCQTEESTTAESPVVSKGSDYDASAAVTISLEGDTAVCSSDAVSIDGGRITILDEGTYIFTGTLNDGQVVVNADDSDKVQIVLSGATITSETSAAIYSLEADKVFITLEDGTENYLANGGEFEAIDDNNIDAAVFSKTDLTINGSGSMIVTSPAGHGIVSKDELTISGGSFEITSGKDGIHAENGEDATLGCLYIEDGSFVIDAKGDAISATGILQIDNGSYTLTTGGGSGAVTMKSGDMMQRFERPGTDDTKETVSSDDTVSCKGIKTDSALTVNGGTYTLDTADDALHAGGDVTINGGEWTIRTGDDGIHSDCAVVIRAGIFSIPYCYEGIEGQTVTIEDGTFEITSNDDGMNAAGGADGSGTSYGFGREDPFAVDEDCFITINGGVITIVSDGDCLDSNGNLTINGGTLNLTCNGNGNTAIDTNGTYTNNGGSVTTNDGSENGNGGKNGGRNRGMFDGGGERPAEGERPGGGEKPAGGERPAGGEKPVGGERPDRGEKPVEDEIQN